MTTDIEICGNLNCHRTALPGMAYCSENCAPFGRLGLSRLKRDLTKGSTMPEHGDPSPQSSKGEKRTKNGARPASEKEPVEHPGPPSPIATNKTPTQNEWAEPTMTPTKMKNGKTGMPKTKNTTSTQSTDIEPIVTPPSVSESLPPYSKKNESDSMSSLTESISTLRTLTTSFGEHALYNDSHASAMTAIGAARALAELVKAKIELTKLEKQQYDR